MAEHTFDEKYGRQLALALRQRQMKPSTLARLIGVDRRTVERWISGRTSISHRHALAVWERLSRPPELAPNQLAACL